MANPTVSRAATLRIGTRGSPLALAQAHELRDRLCAAHPHLEPARIEIVAIQTTGDKVQNRTLAEIGGKGLFTQEIEDALADGRLDMAVHSMKDMPTVLPAGLVIDCLLPREDPRDALFARAGDSLASLPEGCVVGTASLRRAAQVKALRPDVTVVPLRGNVGTRLRKLAEGQVDATLLAVAGLKRLGKLGEATAILTPEEMLPAVAQGAIGVERRADDAATAALLAPINDPATSIRVAAERACLAVLDGSCRTPIAALAELDAGGSELRLRALIALPDGSVTHHDARTGPAAEAVALGRAAGAALKAAGGPGFFRSLG
jgi:hydroxymethylbilane synthase